MAHTYTRLQGFEEGIIDSDLDDSGSNGAAHSIQSVIKRSGEYAFRMNVTASPAQQNVRFVLAYLGTGSIDTASNFAAAAVRFYIYIATAPSGTEDFFRFRTSSSVDKSVLEMTSGRILRLDGITGTTAIPLATWTKITIVYDSAASGAISLKINDVAEFTGVVPTANGAVNSIWYGRVTGANTYDMYFDDCIYEAAAAVASVDHPPSGSIVAIDPVANSATYSQFTPIGALTAALTWQRPYNGNTSYAKNTTTNQRQAVTIEPVGVISLQAVQFYSIVAEIVVGASLQLFARSGGTDSDLTTNYSPPTGAYERLGNLRTVSPFTSTSWTAVELTAMEYGVRVNSSSELRVSTMWIEGEFADAPEVPGVGSNTTYLQQIEMLTGRLMTFTPYSPHIQTIQITSESLGEANKAFNIVACSVRFVPNGNELIRGSWFFDKNATAGFNLDVNPLERSLIDITTEESTFTFGSSTLLDNREVYTQFVQLGGSGKFFQLDLVQTGPRKMDLLSLEFEVKIEGRREAYLYGNF